VVKRLVQLFHSFDFAILTQASMGTDEIHKNFLINAALLHKCFLTSSLPCFSLITLTFLGCSRHFDEQVVEGDLQGYLSDHVFEVLGCGVFSEDPLHP